jgi:hypothetical protein
LGADPEQDPDTLRCRALRIVDSLVIVANSAPNRVNMRCLKLTEDGILVGDAGAHRVDHVDADNYILRAHGAKREHERYQRSQNRRHHASLSSNLAHR